MTIGRPFKAGDRVIVREGDNGDEYVRGAVADAPGGPMLRILLDDGVWVHRFVDDVLHAPDPPPPGPPVARFESGFSLDEEGERYRARQRAMFRGEPDPFTETAYREGDWRKTAARQLCTRDDLQRCVVDEREFLPDGRVKPRVGDVVEVAHAGVWLCVRVGGLGEHCFSGGHSVYSFVAPGWRWPVDAMTADECRAELREILSRLAPAVMMTWTELGTWTELETTAQAVASALNNDGGALAWFACAVEVESGPTLRDILREARRQRDGAG